MRQKGIKVISKSAGGTQSGTQVQSERKARSLGVLGSSTRHVVPGASPGTWVPAQVPQEEVPTSFAFDMGRCAVRTSHGKKSPSQTDGRTLPGPTYMYMVFVSMCSFGKRHSFGCHRFRRYSRLGGCGSRKTRLRISMQYTHQCT